MADRPIIFSAPMVRALMDGRKTQTRRVMNPQPSGIKSARTFGPGWAIAPESNRCTVDFKAPAFVFGDRLYVREAWSGPYAWHNMKPADRRKCGSPQALDVWYWADGNPECGDWESPRPSIHMPRWASRLTLTVTEVRVQRLQDISEDDAAAEGVHATRVMSEGYHLSSPSFVAMFEGLWNSLHGAEAWDANPWVVALTFTVQRGNIDQIGATA